MRKTTAVNPRDETPSFLNIKSKCGGSCVDEAACSAKLTLACSKSASGSSNNEEVCPDEHGSEPLVDDKDAAPFLHGFRNEWCEFTR